VIDGGCRRGTGQPGEKPGVAIRERYRDAVGRGGGRLDESPTANEAAIVIARAHGPSALPKLVVDLHDLPRLDRQGLRRRGRADLPGDGARDAADLPTHVEKPRHLDAIAGLKRRRRSSGRIGIGRIRQGTLKSGKPVALRWGDESRGTGRIGQVLTFRGLERVPVESASAGDIVAITGIEEVNIGLTLCDPENPQGLPPIEVDEPTLAMTFQVNTSPLAGREGKFVTSRQIRDRLMRELQSNVALRVEETADADVFRVAGRGELHLTILVENMRREGYELAVGKPQVLKRVVDGQSQEPFEALTIDIDEGLQGGVMSELGTRRGELLDMVIEGDPSGRGQGRVRLEYRIPARGLIGFQGEFMTMTRGTGLMSHIFDGYDVVKGDIPERHNGVLISNEAGSAVAYSLFTLQERGRLFVEHGTTVYEGMIVGIHSRDNDLVVNPIKEKKLSNVRAAGKDDALLLITPIPLTLEYAVEFINDDELVEVTPQSIRLRKRFLKEHERKRASRESES
jgi:GTP-binding protein